MAAASSRTQTTTNYRLWIRSSKRWLTIKPANRREDGATGRWPGSRSNPPRSAPNSTSSNLATNAPANTANTDQVQTPSASVTDMVLGTLQSASGPTSAPVNSTPPASVTAVPLTGANPSPRPPSKSSPSLSSSPSSPYKLKRYPVSIAIPTDYSLVEPGTPVDVGMQLKACYGNRWWGVTVVGVNQDGTITCNWDDFKGYKYHMLRARI